MNNDQEYSEIKTKILTRLAEQSNKEFKLVKLEKERIEKLKMGSDIKEFIVKMEDIMKIEDENLWNHQTLPHRKILKNKRITLCDKILDRMRFVILLTSHINYKGEMSFRRILRRVDENLYNEIKKMEYFTARYLNFRQLPKLIRENEEQQIAAAMNLIFN